MFDWVLKVLPKLSQAQSSFLGSIYFLPYVNDLPVDAIANVVTYANGVIVYSRYNQRSYLWQQFYLTFGSA